MFIYKKSLQYPVKIDKPNPRLASIILSQYGGPDGELGASLRYLSQRFAMPLPELKATLTDIGTEVPKPGYYRLYNIHKSKRYPAELFCRHFTFYLVRLAVFIFI